MRSIGAILAIGCFTAASVPAAAEPVLVTFEGVLDFVDLEDFPFDDSVYVGGPYSGM